MKLKLFAILFLSLFLIFCKNNSEPKNIEPAQKVNADEEEWIDLFNGKDLSDWEIKIANHNLGENYNNTFKVEDGLLKAVYKEYDSFNNAFGHIYYKEKFSYYRLKLDYRFNGEQAKGGPSWAKNNSGVMLHSQSAQSNGLAQAFPVSIEFQFLSGTDDNPRPTGNLCTPGTAITLNDSLTFQHCIDSSSKFYKPEQWASIEAVVLGDEKMMHIIEQDTVMTYTNPIIGGGLINNGVKEEWEMFGVENADEWVNKDGQPLTEGYIALQAESTPVEFRNIKLLNLSGCMDKTAKNYKSYFVKADNNKCIYE